MMSSNSYLLVFAVAFMGCVLATPMVTRVAVWAGAIDRPDQFRRIHKGATPRLGGLGLAFGVFVGVVFVTAGGYLDGWDGLAAWVRHEWPVLAAALLVLAIGFFDDTRGLSPRVKLLGQAVAVVILYLGGVRIQSFDLLGWGFDLTHPSVAFEAFGRRETVVLPGLAVTLLWFLGCMNIWNLIDGMDGLASGVGLLVSGTLTLVAIHHENVGVAVTAAALAGGLAGFLLYNWHPACIFLGDSGSLLIGLLVGVIGVQGAFKGPSAISILFPILAMGLPISDTALAIFRRWVRNLPLSAADRRHVHHLLIGLGLNPRQAALLLYCFSGFLCGAVLLGVSLGSEQLALGLGVVGCLAFLGVVTSRLNEFASLRGDLHAMLIRGRQERFAAKLTWEAIQRIELCQNAADVRAILEQATRALGCDTVSIGCSLEGRPVPGAEGAACGPDATGLGLAPTLSGPTAIFRLSSGHDLLLTVSLHQSSGSPPAADIAFRFLQKLSAVTAERLERLLTARGDDGGVSPAPTVVRPAAATAPAPAVAVEGPAVPSPVGGSGVPALARSSTARSVSAWLRDSLGRHARAVPQPASLTDD